MLEIAVTVILTGSLGVLIHVVKTGLLRSNLEYYREQIRLTSEDYGRLAKDYGDTRDSNMRLADQVCALQARLQKIRDIPNNGKKPNGGLLKAQRIAGAE